MTPIADMVEQMLSGGIPPEMIVLAVRAAEMAVQQNARASLPVDAAAARRRAWDRDRKRKNSTGISTGKENASLIEDNNTQTINSGKEESKKEQKYSSTGIPPEFHRRKKRAGPIPNDWKPPDRAYSLAAKLGLSVDDIEPRFRDYLASSGKLYADYDAGFCNFIRNTPKFNGANGRGPPVRQQQPSFQDIAEEIRSKFNAPTPTTNQPLEGELDLGGVTRMRSIG